MPRHFPAAKNLGSLVPTGHSVLFSQTCLAAHSCRAIAAVNLFLHPYLPACKPVSSSCCSLLWRNFSYHSHQAPSIQSNLNICSAQLAVIKAIHYSLLLHSSIRAPPRLVLHSCESKKDRERKFNLFLR